MVYMDTNESNTHADPLLGSRWAQLWVHIWAQTLVIFLVYVTKGKISSSTCSHKWNVFAIFMPCPEPPMGISSVGSFPVWSGGSLINFPDL